MTEDKKRILLAIDGSEQAFNAVHYMSSFFPMKNLEVVIFHVMAPRPTYLMEMEYNPSTVYVSDLLEKWSEQVQQEVEEYESKARQILMDQGALQEAVHVEIKKREINVAKDIIKEAENDYDALVVGSRGINPLKGILLGSIATKLVSHMTDTPVWVVEGTPKAGKVLLAMDSSEGAMKALYHLCAMAKDTEWDVTLFHADMVPEGQSYDSTSSIEAFFAEAALILEKEGFRPEQITTKVARGVSSRAGAIIEEARIGGYGTIVVGRRGLSKVKEFFIGRVSNKVVQLRKETAVWLVP
ncbi:MAG: universal stress protein [Proteobacteria bacterium]|nr:universal stress protein [Pseudomonadota bacterium]